MPESGRDQDRFEKSTGVEVTTVKLTYPLNQRQLNGCDELMVNLSKYFHMRDARDNLVIDCPAFRGVPKVKHQ